MIELLPFQQDPSRALRKILKREIVSVNASDTGTGKTYMGLHLIENHDGPAYIICPKAVIPNWERLAPGNVEFVRNIESLRTGRSQWLEREGKTKTFKWHLPPGALLLVDEAHTFSGPSSLNAYALAYLKTLEDVHVHLMSATLADSPAKFRAFGYLMGMHNFVHFRSWAIAKGCFVDNYGNLRYTRRNTEQMEQLHHEIFPRFGVRLRVRDIKDFPDVTIKTMLMGYSGTATYRKEQEAYVRALDENELMDTFGGWADAPSNMKAPNDMVKLLRDRQLAELLKIPSFSDQITDALEEGFSVAVFLNFKHSIDELYQFLPNGIPIVKLTGDMKQAERVESMRQFQENEAQVIICSHGAGGTGVDLHDLHGRPRMSIISPCFWSTQFKQTLGRIHRAGALSAAIQIIACLVGTAEEGVLQTLERKLSNLDALNDADLQEL